MSYKVQKRAEEDIRKGQYYVWYLGWKECRGLAGREFTEPIVKDLVIRRRNDDLPKLTIEVNKMELVIYQQTKSKMGRTEKFKFPSVPAKDVTYAVQCLPPDEDVVACIYLGFQPTTRRVVHVHVYRCDSPVTAATFAEHLMNIVRLPEHEMRIREIEGQLATRGEITPRPKNFIETYAESTVSRTPSTVNTRIHHSLDSDNDSDGPLSPHTRPNNIYGQEEDLNDADPYREEKEQAMEKLANELKQRLSDKTNAPLLLPPQDYETVRRVRGNLDLDDLEAYEARKCKNENIVGGAGMYAGDNKRNSGSSGHDTGAGSSGRHSQSSDYGLERPTSKLANLDNNFRRSTGSDNAGLRNIGYGPDADDIQVKSPPWVAQNSIFVPQNPVASRHSREGSYGSDGLRRTRSPPRQLAISPSPPRYVEDTRGRQVGSPIAEKGIQRTETFGQYPEPQAYFNPFPPGTLPPPGMIAPGMMRGDPEYAYLQRQQSFPPPNDPRQYNMQDLSASTPASTMQYHKQEAAKEKKKKKKKGKEYEEPPPDYTLHPSAYKKSSFVFS